jgi:hypothetical protein
MKALRLALSLAVMVPAWALLGGYARHAVARPLCL